MHVEFDASAFVADPELIEELEKRSTPVDCETERVLFNQDDPAVGLYLLRKGSVVLSMKAEAELPIFSVETGAGSLLGLPAVIGNQPYSLTAMARKGSQVQFHQPGRLHRADAGRSAACRSRSFRSWPPKSAPRAARSTENQGTIKQGPRASRDIGLTC